MNNEELIAEAREFERDFGDSYEVMLHMSELADALEHTTARLREAEATIDTAYAILKEHLGLDHAVQAARTLSVYRTERESR